MKINKIAYFRPDGKDCEPTGICYYKAGIYKQIEENENSFVRSTLTESFLTEKLEILTINMDLANIKVE